MPYEDEYISIADAAQLYKKSKSNINYLIQYERIKDIKKTKKGKLLSRTELRDYFASIQNEKQLIKSQLDGMSEELAFFDLTEKERTKHVHRLHPYLGKYIPQLVEYYLKHNFKTGQTILDPFAGSGTTLVESNALGINSIGIDISEFNCIVMRAKTQAYNIDEVTFELNDILNRVINYFNKKRNQNQTSLLDFVGKSDNIDFTLLESSYFNKWFAQQTIEEMSLYRSLIEEYQYKDLLKIILSRTIRSSRQIFHFELTRPTKPVKEPYYCHKHRGKICAPVQTSLIHLKRYTKDTIRRIKEFDSLRTASDIQVLHGDSCNIKLEDHLGYNPKIDGIITSPPYLGVIDYHDQHKYAYEIFNLDWNEDKEIGSAKKGITKRAQEEYKGLIIKVLQNIKKYLSEEAKLFLIANDKHNLYPDIINVAGYSLIDIELRPVTRKASRERSLYSESIFEFKPCI